MALYFTKVVQHIQQYILDCWQLCNDALHAATAHNQATEILAVQVQHIFDTIGNDTSSGTSTTTRADSLETDWFLQQWVSQHRLHISKQYCILLTSGHSFQLTTPKQPKTSVANFFFSEISLSCFIYFVFLSEITATLWKQ